ncbi:MAG: alpha/beta fold hydrolase [Myxococcales bacterium]|nr:alpha/beta hydrolase [Myxococcota bacterium]MDW8280609.1 alpha/beta fold hydrolase [Myxococcales bacterium]
MSSRATTTSAARGSSTTSGPVDDCTAALPPSEGSQGAEHAEPPRRRRDRNGFALARDGTSIYYEVSGLEPPAPTLLLCDGIGCDGYVWRYLQRVLGEHHRVVHMHYRGHGRSPAPADPERVSVGDLAEDAVAVLDACQAERAVLCGHSMGVQVALETFRRSPQRVAALVLVCGSYGHPLRTFKGKSTLEEVLPLVRLVAARLPRLVTTLWTHLVPTDLAYQIATRVEINGPLIRRQDFFPYLEGMARIDVRLFLNMLSKAGQHTARETLPQVSVPTLIVAGRRDSFTPMALSEEMQRLIPGAELYVVEEGSHTAPIERPAEVSKVIEDFLRRRLPRS